MYRYARKLLLQQVRYQSHTPSETTIGVIGMGMVGSVVTKNLLRNGFKVTSVLDIDKEKCSGYPCKISPNARTLTEETDVIITALPKPIHVKSVFEGPDGILAGVNEGKIWIDHSTTDYEQTHQFATLMQKKKGHLLEAPVTGGFAALEKEQMTNLVAGDKQAFESVESMLKSVYQQVIYTGPIGTALIPKVLSNSFAAMTCMAAAEALLICKRAGIDLETAFHAMRASTGNSFVWETAVPMIYQGTYEPTFSLDLHVKDLKLLSDVAQNYKVPIELLGLVEEMFKRGMYKYGPDAPCYMPAKLLEDELQEELRCEAFKDWSYSIENVDGSAVIRHQGIAMETTGHPQP